MPSNPEIRRVILIGLGGAGQMILLNVKRLLLDTYNIVPPCIRFLSMDTDGAQLKLASKTSDRTYTFDSQEYLHLRVENPVVFLQNSAVARSWFVGDGPTIAITNGTGAIRQNGRLALFHHINEFTSRVRQTVDALTDMRLRHEMESVKQERGSFTDFSLSDKEIEVYICGSIAGGTGSGTFLDAGIYLRHLLPNAIIQGYFLLHWAYRYKPFAVRTPGNAYAALAELDFFQSIASQRGGRRSPAPYTVEYGDERIEVRTPPYSLFHLIDGRNELGQNVASLEMLCETVAEAIMLSAGSVGFGNQSVADNLLTLIGLPHTKVWGKNACYSSFGVSSIYYPARELHRLVAAQNALALCQAALGEATAAAAPERQQAQTELIQTDVMNTIQNVSSYTGVQQRIGPSAIGVSFQPKRYQVRDVALLTQAQQTAEGMMTAQLDADYANEGTALLRTQLEDIESRLAAISADASLGIMYKSSWVNHATACLTRERTDAASEMTAATNEVNDLRTSAANTLQEISRRAYLPLPFLGRERQELVEQLRSTVERLLRRLADQITLKYTIEIYDSLIDLLLRNRPGFAPKIADIANALAETARTLNNKVNEEAAAVAHLQAQTNLVLVGDGKIVFVRREGVGQQSDSKSPESITLDYAAFKQDSHIQTGEEYFRIYQESPGKLTALFLEWSTTKLIYLTDVNVDEAMQAMTDRHDPNYVRNRIDDLFYLSSALWRFDKGRLNEARDLQYDRVINIGVNEKQRGSEAYGKLVENVKAKYHMTKDHVFSTVGDPYRIWLLNFAAPLPAYFLQDLDQARRRYEGEISPTYHIDKNMEMTVPDVFPEDQDRNIALRALGMAIVPGIDVIHDLYLTPLGKRGHEFTWDAEPLKQINYGEPKVWRLFSDMYDEISEDPQLLQLLVALLREKVADSNVKDLREHIGSHIKKLRDKVEGRDFTKLYSARLTYREIVELESFLSPKGYNMEMDRYVPGKRVS